MGKNDNVARTEHVLHRIFGWMMDYDIETHVNVPREVHEELGRRSRQQQTRNHGVDGKKEQEQG